MKQLDDSLAPSSEDDSLSGNRSPEVDTILVVQPRLRDLSSETGTRDPSLDVSAHVSGDVQPSPCADPSHGELLQDGSVSAGPQQDDVLGNVSDQLSSLSIRGLDQDPAQQPAPKTEQELSLERAAHLLREMRRLDPPAGLDHRFNDDDDDDDQCRRLVGSARGHAQQGRYRHNLFLYALLLGTGMMLPQVGQVVSRRFVQPSKPLASVSPLITVPRDASPTPSFLLNPERARKAPSLPSPPAEDDDLELNGVSLSDLPPPIEMPVFVSPQRRMGPPPSSTASVPPQGGSTGVAIEPTPATMATVPPSPLPPAPLSRVSPELPNLRPPMASTADLRLDEPSVAGAASAGAHARQRVDPYADLPVALRESLRQQVNDFLVRQPLTRQLRVLKAENVILKTPTVSTRESEHIPVVMLNDGQVVLLRPPSHARMMASIQAWADAQPLPPEGFVSPVVLSFQPRV